jgi:hypothetical protein
MTERAVSVLVSLYRGAQATRSVQNADLVQRKHASVLDDGRCFEASDSATPAAASVHETTAAAACSEVTAATLWFSSWQQGWKTFHETLLYSAYDPDWKVLHPSTLVHLIAIW